MNEPSNIPWNRIFVEGIAIIASILIAFAIDAWWDNRQESESEVRDLIRVSAELETNSERIQAKLETIVASIQATSTLISWMGPEPAQIDKETLVKQWDDLYGIGFFSLHSSAAGDYLARGRTDTVGNLEARQAISEWYSASTALEEQYNRLRAAHANISDYLQDAIPFLHTISASAVMAGHPSSRFSFDQTSFLADPRLESRLALYLIRMEFVEEQAVDLMDRQSELLALIHKTVEELD
jgi:hypothetical protein